MLHEVDKITRLADGKVIVRVEIRTSTIRRSALELFLQDNCKNTNKIEIGEWKISSFHAHAGFEFCIDGRDWFYIQLKYGEITYDTITPYMTSGYKARINDLYSADKLDLSSLDTLLDDVAE